MAQLIEALNDYSFPSMPQSNDNNNEFLQEKYNLDTYFHSPLPFHIQAECDWMNNASSPSCISTPSSSPTTQPAHLSNATSSISFPTTWPTGPTSTEQAQSIKEIQKLTDAKSRRRQQNRESQRAFRERKNRHIEHLEKALADLQHRHEKLLQCFVGLTAKVSSQNMGGNVDDRSFLDEQPRQYNSYPGKEFKSGGARLDFGGTESDNL